MNYSDTTSALVINKLTKSQYETLKASGSLQSNQIYITPETLPSNLGDFNNDVGYVTASAVAASYATKGEVEVVTASVSDLSSQVGQIDGQVSSLVSSMSEMSSTVPLKRYFFDLEYPNFDDNITDGFGMRFAYSFEGGLGSILTFNGTEYINNEICATWGWHGQILVAMPNQSTIWLFDKYDNLKHTIFLNEFKKATSWLDYVSPAQDDMVIDALEVPRVVYLYLETALDGRDKNTKIVLENQLSAYATTSALESVSANVSALGSQVSAMTSSFASLESSVGAMSSQVSAMTSSLSAKRDYSDLTYGGTYDPSDAEGYYGITSWTIEGYKYNGQTLPTFSTRNRFKDNQTYGTGWNEGTTVIHTSPSNPSDFSTLYLDNFGNSEPVPFTLSMDKTTYEVSFMGTEQQDITLTANLANADRLALNSQLAPITASVSAMSSQIDLTNSHVSAIESTVGEVSASVSTLVASMSGKRDYLDLTYNTTVPAETIDNSNLVDGTDPLYNEKLTFTVNDSVGGEQHLAYDEEEYGIGMWIDHGVDFPQPQFYVQYAGDWGSDPADGKFVLIDGSDVCYQFDLQDGVNVQTFNYTSEMLESTGTLTMTFTGEPGHVVTDTIALQGSVNALASSVEANTSAISANASAIASNASAIADNTSAISANASAIASNASAISAVAGSLNVSGIGCSTVVLSGTYSDSTSFAYNFVIQPSA